MANKMLIDASHPEETRVVVVRGQKVEEFDFESASRRQLRGNIYLAKVTRVEPSLQAAFVEYGGNRHGFLAFSEIHPDYYQIPVADRQALLAEDARAEREEEREDERRRSRPRRARGAPRRSDGGETVAEEVEAAEVGAEDAAPEEAEAERASDESEPDAAPIGAAEVPPELAPAESFDESGAPVTELAPASRFEAEPESAGHGDTPSEGGSADSDALISEAAEVEARAEAAAHAPEAEAEDHGGNGAEHADDEAEPIIEQVGGRGDALEEIPERRRPHRRQYKIQEVIKRRQILLVQVVKEERGTKGAALTTYLSLAGRYSVLMPNTGRGGGISRKITSAADRKRLKEIAQDLEVPEGMGVILRTAGASRTRAEIKRDFEYLMRLWESVRELTLTSSAPALVYEEGSLIKRAIRDLYNKDIDEVMVAGDEAHREAKDFMRMLMPSHAKAVKPYKDPQPLFARFGIEQQLDAMFSNHVTLKSGGYLVINPTEALVSIDVNSGRSTREHNIEDTALRTNMEAAEEIARQLRLRDLAGLIVIDFIDMDEKRNNRAVERKLSDCLRQDRARIQVGRISHFGLLEMSRQRIRASVLESSTEPCAQCGGSGHVRSVSSVALQLLRGIEEILMKGATHNLVVRTRTDVALYVLNHKRGHLRDLENAFKVSLAIVADATVSGQQSFIIDRGEQVHTLEAAKALLAAQAAAFPPQVEEAYDDDESFDVETESEVETEETEGLADDAAEAAAGESEADGHRRKRRRRRRGRGEPRDGAAPREDSDVMRVVGEAVEGTTAEDGEAEEDEGDEQPGMARGDQPAGGERRPRRRGRRGGRRRRGAELEDGLAGSIADELGPPPAVEVTNAVADFDGGASEPAPSLVQADVAPEPVAQPAEMQPAAYAQPEPDARAPEPSAEETGQEAERAAARRRSTVREKVSFVSSAPAEPAPAISHSAPEPVASPAPAPGEPAPATSDEAPRKAGWWSRRFGGGE
ncbi:MAG: Rne/Rng family ribonuclease [Microvirga sp.]